MSRLILSQKKERFSQDMDPLFSAKISSEDSPEPRIGHLKENVFVWFLIL